VDYVNVLDIKFHDYFIFNTGVSQHESIKSHFHECMNVFDGFTLKDDGKVVNQ
jgi:hypothetical protein